MKVEVRLFATLAQYLPADGQGDAVVLDVDDAATVGDVIHRLGIPGAMPRIVLVNGQDATEDRRLAPHDVLSLFPPLAGGRA